MDIPRGERNPLALLAKPKAPSRGYLEFLFVLIFSLFCVYIVSYIAILQQEIGELRILIQSNIEKESQYHSFIQDLQRSNNTEYALIEKINSLDKHTIRLYELVDPWERCLRFKWQINCESPEVNHTNAPCSTDILREMLFDVVDSIEKHSITYWTSYGTLLGAIRNQSIIPWTYDVDVTVPGVQFKMIERDVNKDLSELGYYVFSDNNAPSIARVCILSSSKYAQYAIKGRDTRKYYNSYPYVDIYQTDTKKWEHVIIKYGPLCKFDRQTIFPLSTVRLYDRELAAPANPHLYLTQLYGDDYMTPPPVNKRGSHGAYKDACKNG